MSTGFSFPWEKAAMRGEELPDGLSLPDQMAYTALRNTYRAYYDKTISRDAAAAEKQQIRLAWDRAVSRAAFDQRLTTYHVKVIRETEAAITDRRRNGRCVGSVGGCCTYQAPGAALLPTEDLDAGRTAVPGRSLGYRVDSWNRQEARAHGKRHKSPGGPNGAGWDAEFR